MIDVPNTVSKDFLFDFLSAMSELDEVVDIFLKIFIKELLYISN